VAENDCCGIRKSHTVPSAAVAFCGRGLLRPWPSAAVAFGGRGLRRPWPSAAVAFCGRGLLPLLDGFVTFARQRDNRGQHGRCATMAVSRRLPSCRRASSARCARPLTAEGRLTRCRSSATLSLPRTGDRSSGCVGGRVGAPATGAGGAVEGAAMMLVCRPHPPPPAFSSGTVASALRRHSTVSAVGRSLLPLPLSLSSASPPPPAGGWLSTSPPRFPHRRQDGARDGPPNAPAWVVSSAGISAPVRSGVDVDDQQPPRLDSADGLGSVRTTALRRQDNSLSLFLCLGDDLHCALHRSAQSRHLLLTTADSSRPPSVFIKPII